jgi:hypothetical protein
MTDQDRSDVFREGEAAGSAIDKQAADCPYDHDVDQFGSRQEWLAGFAKGRTTAAPARTARDYRELNSRETVLSDLPAYLPG